MGWRRAHASRAPYALIAGESEELEVTSQWVACNPGILEEPKTGEGQRGWGTMALGRGDQGLGGSVRLCGSWGLVGEVITAALTPPSPQAYWGP